MLIFQRIAVIMVRTQNVRHHCHCENISVLIVQASSHTCCCISCC